MATPTENLKPGSNPEDAHQLGGKGDFGVPEGDVAERAYTSMNTKRADPGAAPGHSFDDGDRTSGVGGNASGPGSSSGGDLDPDFIGLDGKGGVAANGNFNAAPGPDDAPQEGSHPGQRGFVEPTTRDAVRGSTMQRADDRSTAGVGADAASNAGEDNDALGGEVSSSEASGADEAGV